jgi:transglutaminase-like putative cysteine protease
MAIYMLGTVWLITATMIGFQFRSLPAKSYRYQLRNAGLMLLQAVPLMLVLFVLFPRVQGPLWGMPQDVAAGITGLSDEMSPGSVSSMIASDAVAFRVNFKNQIPPTDRLYWRGPVMWDFDGYTWRASRGINSLPRSYEPIGNPVEYTVTVEPHGKRWLFALDLPASAPPHDVMTGDYQLLSPTRIVTRTRYDMASYLDFRDNVELKPYDLRRALRLPPGSNPRTAALARDMRKAAQDDQDYINAVLRMFRIQNFFYTTLPPRLGTNPVDEFLFTTRAGFCEHYASSFVVLMRAAGIPARVVTGYQGGELNYIGNYLIVRQADAHAWAEVWLGDKGWLRVDPTAAVSPARIEEGIAAALPQGEPLPLLLQDKYAWLQRARLTWDSAANSWNQLVLGYTSDRQQQLLRRAGIDDATWEKLAAIMFTITGVVMLLVSALILRQLRTARPDPVAAAYARFCNRLARLGLARHPSEGPDAFRKRAIAVHPEFALPVNIISDLYIRLRYGNSTHTDDLPQFRHAVKSFRPQPKSA